MSITWKISTVLILASALTFGVLLSREYLHNLSLQRDIEAMQAQRAALEQEHSASLELIAQLSQEYYVESEARIKQGLASPGESVIVVTDIPTTAETASPNNTERLSNPELWFAYFFARDHLTVRP